MPLPTRPNPTPATPDDDAAELVLVRRIKSGEAGTSAWWDLLAGYQDRLFSVCLRMVNNRETAADLCQDSMVKILQGLSSFDEQSKLSTWLIRVTMNTCLSHLRAAKLRRHGALDEAGRVLGRDQGSDRDRLAAREPAAGLGVQHGEEQARLAAALARLDGEQRAILVLRDVRGLDYGQIAHVLGVADGTVKSRLFRARAALREAMEALGGAEEGRRRTLET